MQFIDLKTQAKKIEQGINSRIQNVLNHGAYIMGPEVSELEKQLADFVGVKHAIAVASGTDALLIALMALGVGPGDEVITSPFSFFATAEVISHLGATPVFVDICPTTYNIDPAQISAKINDKTKAIMPVSMFGQCAEMDTVNDIAQKHNLAVIEDGAQSFGATYKGKQSCGISTIGCTSFFPSKPLGCYGDGGACFTNDDEIALKIQQIRTHGQSKRYHHTRLGINGRLDTIQAAILLEKLTIFPEEITQRAEVAARYKQLLNNIVVTPYIAETNTSAYAQYTIAVKNRDLFIKHMNAKGVPTAIHYPLGIHRQPIMEELYGVQNNFPNTDKAASQVVSLPMHPYLNEQEQKTVCQAVKESLFLCEKQMREAS